MTAQGLTVGRSVVTDMIRLAAEEVPGVLRVGRGGAAWRGWGRERIVVRRRGERVEVRLWLVARPGHALVPLARDVRAAVAGTIDRLLGLEPAGITVVIDGVGG